MKDVIFQLQMMSASTQFPRAFKIVNYCLIYHTFLALTLFYRRGVLEFLFEIVKHMFSYV